MKIFISSLLGGIIGILLLIPFRKYFVSDMHGKYPFPEATATTQVLVSGEKGGGQAKPLLIAGLVGGLYDFVVATFGWWNENFTSRFIALGQQVADQAKLVFKVNTGCRRVWSGLHHWLQICTHHLPRFAGSLVAHRAGHGTALWRPSAQHVGSEHHANRGQHVA